MRWGDLAREVQLPGRSHATAEIRRALVTDHRVLALMGPEGSGKHEFAAALASAARAAGAVALTIRAHLAEEPRLMSFRLAHQLGVEQPRAHEMAELVTAIRGALRSGTDEGRTFALILEDLHLCHSSDFVLVDELISVAESRPEILLVVTTKSDKIPLRSRESLFNTVRLLRANPKSSVVRLEPMDLDEVSEVLSDRIPGRAHRPQVVEYMREYCGGDFGSVTQLTDYILEQDAKTRAELLEGFTDFARIGIPGEVVDRYRPDLLAVPRESVVVLRSLAAWRLPARIETISAISEQTEEFIDPIVDDLEERGFISLEPDEFFSLKPPLIADVLRTIMPGRKLRVLREKAFHLLSELEAPNAEQLHMWAEHAVSRRSVDPDRAHLQDALEMLVDSGRYRLAAALLNVVDQSSTGEVADTASAVPQAIRLQIAWQQGRIGPEELRAELQGPAAVREAALRLLLDSVAVDQMDEVLEGLPESLLDFVRQGRSIPAAREAETPLAGLLDPRLVGSSRSSSDRGADARLGALAAFASASLTKIPFDQALEKIGHARRVADSEGKFRLVSEMSIIEATASFAYGDLTRAASLARHARDIAAHFRAERLAITADMLLSLCAEGEPDSEYLQQDSSPVNDVLCQTIWAVGRSELLAIQGLREEAFHVLDPLRAEFESTLGYPFLAWMVLQQASFLAFALEDPRHLSGVRRALTRMARRHQSLLLQAELVVAMSRMACLDDQSAESAELLSRAIGTFQKVASPRSVARCLIERGALWVDVGDVDSAADDFRSAYQLATEQHDLKGRQDAKAALRAIGRQPRLKRRKRAEGLSPREREVALLAAEGLTDQRIGEQLGISRRTVTSHMTAILRKLGVRSRFEIARPHLV